MDVYQKANQLQHERDQARVAVAKLEAERDALRCESLRWKEWHKDSDDENTILRARCERLEGALGDAREAIASQPEDAFGFVAPVFDDDTGYYVRDALIDTITKALADAAQGEARGGDAPQPESASYQSATNQEQFSSSVSAEGQPVRVGDDVMHTADGYTSIGCITRIYPDSSFEMKTPSGEIAKCGMTELFVHIPPMPTIPEGYVWVGCRVPEEGELHMSIGGCGVLRNRPNIPYDHELYGKRRHIVRKDGGAA